MIVPPGPTVQTVVTSTVITCPDALDEPIVTGQVAPPTADQSPSVDTSPGVATGLAFGAVKPVGIVKVGLAASTVIPDAPTVKTTMNVCEVDFVTVTFEEPSIVAAPSPATANARGAEAPNARIERMTGTERRSAFFMVMVSIDKR